MVIILRSIDSPTFKISMKEYQEMAIRVGDKVGIEINKLELLTAHYKKEHPESF